MIPRRYRHFSSGRRGFTLIELLVVVVIIGILASVALPSFVGAQDKARNASVQSNARTFQMALEQYATEHNGAFPGVATGAWTTDKFVGASSSYLAGGTLPRSPWAASPRCSPASARSALAQTSRGKIGSARASSCWRS